MMIHQVTGDSLGMLQDLDGVGMKRMRGTLRRVKNASLYSHNENRAWFSSNVISFGILVMPSSPFPTFD